MFYFLFFQIIQGEAKDEMGKEKEENAEKFGKLKEITSSPVVSVVAFNVESNQSVVFSTTHAQDASGQAFHNIDFNDTEV